MYSVPFDDSFGLPPSDVEAVLRGVLQGRACFGVSDTMVEMIIDVVTRHRRTIRQ